MVDYQLERPDDLGKLVVVGGPGGTGSTTIAKILAKKWGLHRVSGGDIMRHNGIANKDLDEYLEGQVTAHPEIDKNIDRFLVQMSYYPDMLIEGKNFAAIATTMGIPCTVKIWITADMHTRVMRILEREGQLGKKDGPQKEVSRKSKMYQDAQADLMNRQSSDIRRWKNIYHMDLSHPEQFNDVVIDTTGINVPITIEKIMKMISDDERLSLRFDPKDLKY